MLAPTNNGTVIFTNAQYAIAPGDRYGLELRIVRTADGVHCRLPKPAGKIEHLFSMGPVYSENLRAGK